MSRGYSADRLRAGLTSVPIATAYRIIRQVHVATPLGAVPSPSRFSDPKGVFSVLYASASIRCSAWEAVIRARLDRRQHREIPRAEIEDRLVVTLRARAALTLLDLRDDGPVRIGAPTAVAHDANHAAGRTLSGFVHAHVPEAMGFVFRSRFIGHDCIALYDRAFADLETLSVDPLARSADLHEALDDYDVTLTVP